MVGFALSERYMMVKKQVNILLKEVRPFQKIPA